MRSRACSSEFAQRAQVISEHATGVDLFLDLDAMDDEATERVRKRLAEALSALGRRPLKGASAS